MIVGPPGSGKTVLMKSRSCKLPWGSGTVWIQDVPARLWPSKKRDACMCTCPARRGLACPVADPAACSLVQNYGTGGPVNVTFRFREALRLLGVEHLEKRCGPILADRDRRRLELAFTLAPFLSGSDTLPRTSISSISPSDWTKPRPLSRKGLPSTCTSGWRIAPARASVRKAGFS